MANDFPSASQRTPDLTNLTIIHTEINALETQILIDRAVGLRETILSNTVLTSSAVGSVVTPINYLSGTTVAADADTIKVLDGGSTFILNDTTITFFNQVDGTNGAPDAATTNIIITSSVVGSGTRRAYRLGIANRRAGVYDGRSGVGRSGSALMARTEGTQ